MKDQKNIDLIKPEPKYAVKLLQEKLQRMHGPKEITSGAMGMSLTCSTFVPTTKQDIFIKPVNEWETRRLVVYDKGYVTLHTNMGVINLELDCDLCPLSCTNFLTHCKNKYYDGTIFHRNIRNFMIQGGDPSHSGTGGNSIWGKPFPDECRAKLTHDGRGVLGMANAGRNTNGSQFYITYRSAHHLDQKNTIFGRVVGGMETLDKMEKVQVLTDDKPVTDIVLESTTVFVDPYAGINDKAESKKKAETDKKLEQDKLMGEAAMFVASSKGPTASGGSVGKYMKRPDAPTDSDVKNKKPSYGNFGAF